MLAFFLLSYHCCGCVSRAADRDMRTLLVVFRSGLFYSAVPGLVGPCVFLLCSPSRVRAENLLLPFFDFVFCFFFVVEGCSSFVWIRKRDVALLASAPTTLTLPFLFLFPNRDVLPWQLTFVRVHFDSRWCNLFYWAICECRCFPYLVIPPSFLSA